MKAHMQTKYLLSLNNNIFRVNVTKELFKLQLFSLTFTLYYFIKYPQHVEGLLLL